MTAPSTRLSDVEVGGRRVDVRMVGDRIVAVGSNLETSRSDVVVDGRGGLLLPGLHDHHLHLFAIAAAQRSVDTSGLGDLDQVGRALRAAPGQGWVRAVGYHESIGGDVDRGVLDALVPDRPVRLQHRSGALWMLNSAALASVTEALDDSPDVERVDGVPNGRLWRYDERLRTALPTRLPELDATGAQLAELGLTSVTDATPHLGAEAIGHLEQARRTGALPQRVTVLGGRPDASGGLESGPTKLLLHDHDLPTFDRLVSEIRAARAADRGVAVHCVTRESLLLTLAALDEVGRRGDDRIEHAAVVVDAERLRGLRVVTQPGFISARGDDYAAEVDPEDLPFLYPFGRLLAAGVTTWASSDAPHGPLDPWAVLRAARDRRTPSGRVLGTSERVSVAQALVGYLTDPGGSPRRIERGAPADVVLMHGDREAVLAEPSAERVRGVWIAGRRLR